MWIFFSEKRKNLHGKLKQLYYNFFLSLVLKLYIARVGSGSGENYPDPAKKVRIRNPD